MKIYKPNNIFILDLIMATLFLVVTPFILLGALILILIRELFSCVNNKFMLN